MRFAREKPRVPWAALWFGYLILILLVGGRGHWQEAIVWFVVRFVRLWDWFERLW